MIIFLQMTIGIMASFFINMLILSIPALNYIFQEFVRQEEADDKINAFVGFSSKEKRTVFLLFNTIKYSVIWIILVILFQMVINLG